MAEENKVEIDKQFVLDELQKFIQPYLVYDQGGKCIEALTEIAWGVYNTDLKNLSSRDLEETFSPKLIRSAAKQALRMNMADEDPTVNEFPVVPFKPEMTSQSMREIWESVSEADLLEMNGGVHPVDSIDKNDAEPISFEAIKAGWLVYVGPGRYNIGVPDRDNPEETVYAINPQTKLCYKFNFEMMAEELEQRRI